MSDDVTVLVFKDNYASKTFQLPLTWLSRLGFLVGVFLGITLLSAFFAVKYYRAARLGSPAHFDDLQEKIRGLEAKVLAAQSIKSVAPAPALTPVSQNIPIASTLAQAPNFLFSALPAGTQPPPDASKIRISVNQPKASWEGKKLRVQFDIQYISEDGGNQQGRIIILARGPGSMLAYPTGVINPTDSGTLIAHENGEYFSVSRFRAVNADLGSVANTSALKEAEVLIFAPTGDVLIYKKVLLGGTQKQESESAE